MTKRSKKRSVRQVQAERILREQAKTGRSLPDLADEAGVPYTTVLYWRKRLLAGGPRAESRCAELGKGRFVAVEVLGQESGRGRAGAFEVVLAGGRRVKVPEGFDAEALRELVSVLES